MKNNRLGKTKLFSKKIIGFFLVSLIFPVFILAEEPTKGIVITGGFTDSGGVHEQEIIAQGVAKTFKVRPVWTYDQTDIITVALEALATLKGIGSTRNGLEEPLLSQISGYQETVMCHSLGVRTAVSLGMRGILWGDVLYAVSPVFTSQGDIRYLRDLTSQGKGFNKIVLYTGDDMIPNFKELHVNFRDQTIGVKITDNSEISGIKLVYEDRGRTVDLLEFFLSVFATRVKAQLGKEPVSVIIYGDDRDVPGNRIEIIWDNGMKESFNLQRDTLTGNDFQNEDGIFAIPLYVGFPHGLSQLEFLYKFQVKYGRMPGKGDLLRFKQLYEESRSKSGTTVIQARDPNELSVAPEGNVKPGDTLTYTIQYENEGEGIAYGVYFTNTLQQDLDETTLTIGPVLDAVTGQQIGGPGIYNSQTRTITWFVGEVGSKQGGSATFSVKVKDTTPNNSEVINFATVYFPSVPEETRTNGVVNIVKAIIDNIPPITIASVSPGPNQAGWNNQDLTITLTATDNPDGAGVKEIHYKLTGAVNDERAVSSNSTQLSITAEGMTNLTYYSLDNEGNKEIENSLLIKLDKTPPTITAQTSPQPNSLGWHNSDVTLTFSANDTLSGVAAVSQPQVITTEGKDQIIGGQATDLAGNSVSTHVTLNIDKTPPTLNISATPNILWPPNNKMVDVSISGGATDALSGIAQTTFKVEDEYNKVEPPISGFGSVIKFESSRGGTDKDGRLYTISVITKDKADNQAIATTTVTCPHDQGKK